MNFVFDIIIKNSGFWSFLLSLFFALGSFFSSLYWNRFHEGLKIAPDIVVGTKHIHIITMLVFYQSAW